MKSGTFTCKENDSIQTSIGNIKISLSEIQNKKPNVLSKSISDSIKLALQLKQEKEKEKSNSIQLKLLKASNLPIPVYDTKYFDSDDLIGLIGEIISENFIINNNNDNNTFYIKWREFGTSKSRGLDLIFENDGTLLIFECKNPHKSFSKINPKYNDVIAHALDEAFIQNSDLKVIHDIIRLYNRYFKQRRFLSANGMTTDEMDEKITIIEKCIDKNSFKVNGSVTTDKKSLKHITLKNLESKIHFDKFPTTSVNSAIIISVKDLQQEIKTMLITYCKK